MMHLDDFEMMLAEQERQQEYFEGSRPESRAEQRELAGRYVTYLLGEAAEYLEAIGYHRHKLAPEAHRSVRLNEVVDMLKYLLAIAWVEGFDSYEMMSTFRTKTAVVYERARQEAVGARIAGFDIDGVLANIEAGGYERDWSVEQQDAWMEQAGIAGLPVYVQTVEALRQLRAAGWSIVLMTARKRRRHANIEHETYAWLAQHGVPYDLVLWGYDKVETLAEADIKPSFFVEDSAKHALDLAAWGVDVYYVGSQTIVDPRTFSLNLDTLSQAFAEAGFYERSVG